MKNCPFSRFRYLVALPIFVAQGLLSNPPLMAAEKSKKIDVSEVAVQEESTVWITEEQGWSAHRVFGLCRTNADTVLAFNEVRLGDGSDISPHHLVLKRSTDHGKIWSDNIFIEQCTNGEAWANPTPVVERTTGKIFLFYALNHENNATQVFYRTSDDDGRNWSDRVEVTNLFENDPLKRLFHLPGPGHGIQTSDGKLVLPIWHRYSLKDEAGENRPAENRGYSVSLLISEDAGATWFSGGYLPDSHGANESRVTELNDGRLLLNARSGNGDPEKSETTRILAITPPDGRTWSDTSSDTAMRPFIKCDSALITAQVLSKTHTRDVLLFSRPDHPKQRRNTTVSISTDSGASWPVDIFVNEGSGYSDMIEFSDGTIGLLYAKAGPATRHSGPVVFARFQIDSLVNAEN